MNRRRFLQVLTGSALSAVAAEAIPFNRVWSFPSKIRAFESGEAMFFLDYGPYRLVSPHGPITLNPPDHSKRVYQKNHIYAVHGLKS